MDLFMIYNLSYFSYLFSPILQFFMNFLLLYWHGKLNFFRSHLSKDLLQQIEARSRSLHFIYAIIILANEFLSLLFEEIDSVDSVE